MVEAMSHPKVVFAVPVGDTHRGGTFLYNLVGLYRGRVGRYGIGALSP